MVIKNELAKLTFKICKNVNFDIFIKDTEMYLNSKLIDSKEELLDILNIESFENLVDFNVEDGQLDENRCIDIEPNSIALPYKSKFSKVVSYFVIIIKDNIIDKFYDFVLYENGYQIYEFNYELDFKDYIMYEKIKNMRREE